jgi:hypothetical protein
MLRCLHRKLRKRNYITAQRKKTIQYTQMCMLMYGCVTNKTFNWNDPTPLCTS